MYITVKSIHEKLRKYKNVLLFFTGFLIVVFFSVFFLSVQKPMIKSTKTIIPIAKDAVIVPDQIIVKFKEGYAPKELEENIKRRNAANKSPIESVNILIEDVSFQISGEEKIEKRYEVVTSHFKEIGVTGYEKAFDSNEGTLKNYYLLFLQKEANVRVVKDKLDLFSEIYIAEPNYEVSIQTSPNDSLYSQQWNMKKISMEKAWDVYKGSDKVIVAVVDTGIDYTQEDLAGNVIKGKDVINKDNDSMDDHGHGTHVAGIIGAIGNNGKGVAGINWAVKILAVKILDRDGKGNTLSLAQGIDYATQNGAKVINVSTGGEGACNNEPLLQDSINVATQKGIVVVVAAGNKDKDASEFNPASCNNVITVGATDKADKRVSFSNYGTKVRISAPGVSILSTKSSQCNESLGSTGFCNVPQAIVGGNYMLVSGTSQASPHVAGVAGLLIALNPGITVSKVKDCLIQNADAISTDKPIGPRLNAQKTLENCKNVPVVLPDTLTPAPDSPPISAPVPISGKVLCVPEGGMQNKLNSIALQVTNGKNEQVPVWIQDNICDYSTKTPVVEGYQCNLYKRRYFDTLDPGEQKTYTFSVPACKVGQIDVNTNNTTSKNYGGCFTPDNFQWTDGIGYAILANPTGCSATTAPIASPKVTSSPGASGYTCVPDKECESKGLQICNLKCTPN